MTEEQPESKNISTLFTYDTMYSSDSVEWCPHDPFKHLFVCANYQLKENKQDEPCQRSGRILLFSACPTLCLLQTLDTPAVLDQKWCHFKVDGRSLLGVANAERTLEIYELKIDTKLELMKMDANLELIASCKVDASDSETLVLSLDWSTGKHVSGCIEIVCSDSKGNVHLFSFNEDKLVLIGTWNGHAFEAWIAGFYYWDTNIFFSGGDDSVFLKYDKRVSDPVAKNRSHEAGVTSLHSNAKREFTLVTGSYDQNVRLWDTRLMKRPVTELKMPGTLWRLKWDPFAGSHLLAACMLGGVHVIKNGFSEEVLEIVESYYEHKNIAYGADWCHLTGEEFGGLGNGNNVVIGTCSFYDHLLCIASLNCDFNII